MTSSNAAAALADIRARIARAEAEARRPAGSVRLVAVSKTYGADDILPAPKPASACSARTACRKRRANGRR